MIGALEEGTHVIATRFGRVAISATMQVSAAAKRMRAEGVDIVDLSMGEPDFPTPDHIKAAAKRAIDQNETRYTINAGTVALRKAIAERMRLDFGLEYELDEIIVSSGAKQSMFNAYAALVDPGDRVLIPAPFWVSYPEMVKLLGGDPIVIPCDESAGFLLTPESLGPHLDGAKVLTLNSPSNPTGATYEPDVLRELVTMAVEAGVTVISDEIYEKMTYPPTTALSAASVSEAAKARTVVVNGVSKTYAMTGWRIGYAAGPGDVIKAMGVLQSHSTSNACSVSQAASLAALSGPQDVVTEMVGEFAARRSLAMERLAGIPGWTCVTPGGAFYLFPNASASLGTRHPQFGNVDTTIDLATYLIEHGHVAVVPGEGFGAPGFLRLSYAASRERITTAFDRIRSALDALRPR